MASQLVIPAALCPGDEVRVVAPSSPFDRTLLWRGMGWLAKRYRVRFDRRIFDTRGYLAGRDDLREEELRHALSEPDTKAIFCARGGYGASRFVHRMDWSELRRHPKWIVGFSDVTAMHVEAARVGVATVHGPNVTGLGRGDAVTRMQLVDVLERPGRTHIEGMNVLVDGSARGPLIGGNLSLLHACAAAGRLSLPDGCVLLIEDITERPYRIDRMLTTLIASGQLERACAIVVGEMISCHPGPDGVTVAQVIEELLLPLGIPLVTGAPIGHGRNNLAVILGTRVEVTAGTLRALPEDCLPED